MPPCSCTSNYNALAIGFGAYRAGIRRGVLDCAVPRWTNLFFLQGAALPDPQKLFNGSGKLVRSIRLENVRVLDDPKLLALIDAEAARLGLTPGDWQRQDRDQIDFGQAASAAIR